MRTSPYTRAGRVRRKPFKRRPARGRRFVVVFAVSFSAACFFIGGDLLAYAVEGNFLLLGLAALICAIIAGATLCSTQFEVNHHEPITMVGRSAQDHSDDYLLNPNSSGYLYGRDD